MDISRSALFRPGPLEDGGTAVSRNILVSIEFLRDSFIAFTQTDQNGITSTPLDLDLTLIDQALFRILAQVRFLRNTSLPVMRLPREVLATIFETLQDVLYRESQCYPYSAHGKPNYSWMHILLVCRHWHDVAVCCTSLWDTIFVNSRRKDLDSQLTAARRMLHHSQEHQLLVCLTLPAYHHSDCDNFLLDVLSQLHRIRVLQLESYLSAAAQQLLMKLQPAPFLRKLSLHISPYQEPRAESRPLLLGGFAPLLHTLVLSGPIDHAWKGISNLRHIHLERAQPFSRSEPLRFLEETLALESLRVDSPWMVDIRDNRARRCLPLLKLKRLTFTVSCNEKHLVGRLLSRLQLGPNVHLVCTIQQYPSPNHGTLRALFPDDVSEYPGLNGIRVVDRLQLTLSIGDYELIAANDVSSYRIRLCTEASVAIPESMRHILADTRLLSSLVQEMWVVCHIGFWSLVDVSAVDSFHDVLSGAPALTKLFIEEYFDYDDSCLRALGGRTLNETVIQHSLSRVTRATYTASVITEHGGRQGCTSGEDKQWVPSAGNPMRILGSFQSWYSIRSLPPPRSFHID
ncbi:hypothetical protein NM688_g1396 [Phlebia brevispora]|uniref:Uncharacterized protein n=1 Tax=Phlebia brevispora TaxID=194682 RepID=A0ACC1TBE5_9APHY|nr:hypothetical protein NM688_g1396 [Phlebia brevispora]